MKKKPISTFRQLTCSLCGTIQGQFALCEGGHVCDACSEQGRQGRDNTTRAVKLQQSAERGQSQAARIKYNGGEIDENLDYSIAGAELFAQDGYEADRPPQLGAGGEVIPEHDLALRDTLAAPDAAALDASVHRLDLVTSLGTDVAAMALDTAQTVGASNSLEKMYCHQLAVLHNSSMQMVSKATLESDPVIAMRMMNLGIRAAEVFQRGAVNLKRLRGGSQQVMRIEHVHIAPGAQAIVGPVQTARRPK